MYNVNIVSIFVKKNYKMTFDKILDDGRLWAVRYDEKEQNCFDELFDRWYDMQWLKSFFTDNLSDLSAYFRITDVYKAIMETIEDASTFGMPDAGHKSGRKPKYTFQTS